MRSGCAYGSGLSNTVLTTEKIAVFAPIPSANVSTATNVRPGFLANIRTPNRKSCQNLFIIHPYRNSESLESPESPESPESLALNPDSPDSLDSLDSPDCYSYLSAIIGSTFIARQAGTKLAASETPMSSDEISKKVAGSVALTP